MTTVLRSEFDALWKETLTLQFHDILPGSCISRVYQEAEKEYRKLAGKVDEVIHDARSLLINNIDTSTFKNPHAIFNTTSFDRNEWVNIDNNWMKARLNSYGYAVIEPQNETVNGLKAECRSIENDLIRLLFLTMAI